MFFCAFLDVFLNKGTVCLFEGLTRSFVYTG